MRLPNRSAADWTLEHLGGDGPRSRRAKCVSFRTPWRTGRGGGAFLCLQGVRSGRGRRPRAYPGERLTPAPCAPSSALPGSRPHWHSGPNQPLCGPITLRQRMHQVRSTGSGGFGMSPRYGTDQESPQSVQSPCSVNSRSREIDRRVQCVAEAILRGTVGHDQSPMQKLAPPVDEPFRQHHYGDAAG